MKSLETSRLILRKLRPDDFEAIHSYASEAENVRFMPFGPNSEEQTRAFIRRSIESAEKEPCTDYQYAVILKESDRLIGACGITMRGSLQGEVGWILHRDFWQQGYGTELAAALLAFGFEELNLHRIAAHCDADNIGSYRVMEKNGMRREGLFVQSRPPKDPALETWHDELSYAILASEWRTFWQCPQTAR